MPKVFCTKCGIQGSSKCPNHRNVFTWLPIELEIIEMMTRVARVSEPNDEGRAQYEVKFTTSATNSQEALSDVFKMLGRLTEDHRKVASCIHEYDFAPGERSSIGCGCESSSTVMPENPFPKER